MRHFMFSKFLSRKGEEEIAYGFVLGLFPPSRIMEKCW